MLKKIFMNEELKQKLEEANGRIEALEHRIGVNMKYVEELKDENRGLRSINRLLNERIEELKNTPNQFGRTTRATNRNLNILRELKNEGLSYSKIAKRMTELRNEYWSKRASFHIVIQCA